MFCAWFTEGVWSVLNQWLILLGFSYIVLSNEILVAQCRLVNAYDIVAGRVVYGGDYSGCCAATDGTKLFLLL